tara:strand:+ start:182 stop:844 length:663 start_codon:yes stop_codon:yes gene_type:complete
MRLRGFTPIIDEVVQKHDLICAVVLGAIWRYTEMGANNKCYATQRTLATKCGVAIATIYRCTKKLAADGYIKDISEHKNKKVYVVNEERLSLEMGIKSQPISVTRQPDVQRYINKDSSTQKKSKRDVAVEAAEDYFYKVTSLPRPPDDTNKSVLVTTVYVPLGRIAKELGYDCDIIRECIGKAFTRLNKDSLTVSTPKSLEKTAMVVIGEMRRDGLAPRP